MWVTNCAAGKLGQKIMESVTCDCHRTCQACDNVIGVQQNMQQPSPRKTSPPPCVPAPADPSHLPCAQQLVVLQQLASPPT